MKLLRTQDERFKNLPDYPFEPNYVQVGEKSLSIRLHYVDEGDKDAEPVLLMHGEPARAKISKASKFIDAKTLIIV